MPIKLTLHCFTGRHGTFPSCFHPHQQQQQADAGEGSAQQQAAAPTETLSGGSVLEDRARHHEMTDDSDDGEGVHALEMELLAEAGDEFEDEYEVEGTQPQP